MKLGKIGFYVESFTAELSQFFIKNINIFLFGGWLGAHHQGFSWSFLVF